MEIFFVCSESGRKGAGHRTAVLAISWRRTAFSLELLLADLYEPE